MNTFQKFMMDPEHFDIALKVAMLYHPKKSKFKITVETQYDRVVIKGHEISIGIEFKVPLMGPGWKLDTFEKIFKEGRFTAWRFVDDGQFKTKDPDVNQLFDCNNVPRPTAQEMMKYYYQD